MLNKLIGSTARLVGQGGKGFVNWCKETADQVKIEHEVGVRLAQQPKAAKAAKPKFTPAELKAIAKRVAELS